jgi:hypothetical protein
LLPYRVDYLSEGRFSASIIIDISTTIPISLPLHDFENYGFTRS